MNRLSAVLLTIVLIIALRLNLSSQASPATSASAYLGFDRNDYPGDANLKLLRQTFSYAGFWLNQPPGEKANTWAGKRQAVQSAGFGFLVLFNGRLFSQLKTALNAGRLGRSDAEAAVAAARREGFREGTVIFLDQEEGGRMLPQQKAYIYSWVDGVAAAGFRSGIYCSGIAAKEDGGVSVAGTLAGVAISAGAAVPAGTGAASGAAPTPDAGVVAGAGVAATPGSDAVSLAPGLAPS